MSILAFENKKIIFPVDTTKLQNKLDELIILNKLSGINVSYEHTSLLSSNYYNIYFNEPFTIIHHLQITFRTDLKDNVFRVEICTDIYSLYTGLEVDEIINVLNKLIQGEYNE